MMTSDRVVLDLREIEPGVVVAVAVGPAVLQRRPSRTRGRTGRPGPRPRGTRRRTPAGRRAREAGHARARSARPARCGFDQDGEFQLSKSGSRSSLAAPPGVVEPALARAASRSGAPSRVVEQPLREVDLPDVRLEPRGLVDDRASRVPRRGARRGCPRSCPGSPRCRRRGSEARGAARAPSATTIRCRRCSADDDDDLAEDLLGEVVGRRDDPAERTRRAAASAAASASIAAHRVLPQRTPHATIRRDAFDRWTGTWPGCGVYPSISKSRALAELNRRGRSRSLQSSFSPGFSTSISYSRLMIVLDLDRGPLRRLAADEPLAFERDRRAPERVCVACRGSASVERLERLASGAPGRPSGAAPSSLRASRPPSGRRPRAPSSRSRRSGPASPRASRAPSTDRLFTPNCSAIAS